MDEELHPLFQDMLRVTDGCWPGEYVSRPDYYFVTRQPALPVLFFALTILAAVLSNIGNFLVSCLFN
ncbi:hypothetical protein DPMN_172051 [Dreissena polymorpha]|uniref:Uncharacterized protein n=1 Tax=Dreissena polymorpha TaxID=45954 RepID=A0A9D4E0V1_DREPO|nr:hypothetical protein DPMN_172051 [Dreissena polymorpha]